MELKIFLDRLLKQYHRTEFLWSDPLEFVHRHSDPFDQEAVALFAAVLAYGNVKQIKKSVENLLSRASTIAKSPAEFIRETERAPEASLEAFDGFAHRFNVGADIVLLSVLLGRSWREHGSLGAHFLTHLDPAASDITDALNGLISEWRQWVRRDPFLSALFKKSPSFSYLLTAPADGSCCKRWCMLLRWMGRSDSIDVGLWTEKSGLSQTFPAGRFLKASQLVLPLDTHTGRISQYIRLTERKSLNWLAALEVTKTLRGCDPADPTRYDFALARLGILDFCRRKYREEICSRCDLLQVCRFAKASKASQRRKSVRN